MGRPCRQPHQHSRCAQRLPGNDSRGGAAFIVFTDYTYTLETIIQAGQKNMAIVSVPIRVNKDLRPSRLLKSIPSYIQRSIGTMVRIFVIYRPFRFFGVIGGALFLLGFLIGLRFVFRYLIGDGDGHVQSLILASVLLGMGFQTVLVAFLADLLAANRKLLEDIRVTVKRAPTDMSHNTVNLEDVTLRQQASTPLGHHGSATEADTRAENVVASR